MERPKWIDSPKIGTELNSGTGKSAVTGTVEIVFTGNGRAVVNTTGSHNVSNSPAVHFRDRDYLIHIYYKQIGRHWVADDVSVNQRGAISGSAPRTITDAITAAATEALTAAWSDEVQAAADYARAARDLHDLVGERQELADKLADLDARIAEARKVPYAVLSK